jgi:Chalcone isomerase-like
VADYSRLERDLAVGLAKDSCRICRLSRRALGNTLADCCFMRATRFGESLVNILSRLSAPWRSSVVVAALLCSLAPAAAAPTQSTFEPSIKVGATTLQLNGKGTRYRLAFKVYDMALYTTNKVTTSAELLALPGAKRLQFVALRDISGTDIGRLFVRGMADNASSQVMNRHTLSSARLTEVFSQRPKIVTGESFAIEFEPGKGTSFYVLGKPQGAPVGDDEFFSLVLKIWFGESPADWLLRDALLDQTKQ